MDAKDIDLVALQGWAGDRMNALITRGAASFRGKVKAEGSPVKVALIGDSKFTNFNVLDKLATTDLMRWRSLDISGIEFVNEPLAGERKFDRNCGFFCLRVSFPPGRAQP